MKVYDKNSRSAQVMTMSVIFIGGALMAASAVAGLVLFYEIRQQNDSVQSTSAIYAADTGIEAALRCYYYDYTGGASIEGSCERANIHTDLYSAGSIGDGNGSATYSTTFACYSDLARTTKVANCTDSSVKSMVISSTGQAGSITRQLQHFIDFY